MHHGITLPTVLSAALLSFAVSAQTVVSIDVNPSGDSAPRFFADANGTLYFTADGGAEGRELWKTDGTSGGTTLVADIEPGAVGSDPSQTKVTGSTLFCTATTSAKGTELVAVDLKTDTATVIDILPGSGSSNPGIVTFFQGMAYFAATGLSGRELWKSDGTPSGTTMVADLEAGGDSNPVYLCVHQHKLYFQATTAANGAELYETNGSLTGTQLTADLISGATGSTPEFMTSFRGQLMFVADTPANGRELILWDGATATTVDIAAGAASSSPRPGRSNNYPPGNGDRFLTNPEVTYFRAEADGKGIELWRFDGTTASLVKDIRPGSKGAQPYDLTFVGELLYFTANDGTNGLEPFTSGGTEATTTRLADLGTGATSSNSENYTPLGSERCIFESKVSGSGEELVITDGSTTQVINVLPGTGSSFAANLKPIEGRVYFNGNAAGIGDELHYIETGAMTLPYGTGCSTEDAAPRATGTDAKIGQGFTVKLDTARASALSFLCIGQRSPTVSQVDFGGGCYLWLDFSRRVYVFPVMTDNTGNFELTGALNSDPSVVGLSVGVMFAVAGNPGQPPLGLDFSNLLMMTIGQ